ncbi:MAG: plasmid recombination protein [Oscillospiraceae bacterium]|nr:plasmid recombination protein [Oscillospiraceae bacterium]
MVETRITASPEFMNAMPQREQREYLQRAFAFMENKIGRGNIISAVVHNDEKTPHMHLSFCPITPDMKLSAKYILGNQAQLSRWPELERGLSAMETGRKHIPLSLFKQAERLDKHIAAVETAINDIGIIGNAKKREAAVKVLHKWLPRAQCFTAKVNKVDGYIKVLEQKERDAQERIVRTEQRGERSADYALAQAQAQMDETKRHLREEYERSAKLRRQCRNQEALINKIPRKQRDELMAQVKSQKERTQDR